jgi:hypothetical protein
MYYGPTQKAYGALAASLNRATDGSLVAPGEYLEVVITRR